MRIASPASEANLKKARLVSCICCCSRAFTSRESTWQKGIVGVACSEPLHRAVWREMAWGVVQSIRLVISLGLNPGSARPSYASVSKFLILFLVASYENITFFMELLEVNEFMDLEHSAPCLAHNRCSINISYYF